MRHNRADPQEQEGGEQRGGEDPQDGQQFIMGDENEQLEYANAGDDPGAPLAQDANPVRIPNARQVWHNQSSFLGPREEEMMP